MTCPRCGGAIPAGRSGPRVSTRRPAFEPVSAPALASSEPEETAWIWRRYIPEGGLVLLAAPPKLGKTTAAYHLAGAVEEGRDFLGQRTRKAPVLILAVEERRQDAANRARTLGFGDEVYIHSGPLRTDTIADVAAFVVGKRIGLIIVDTLPRYWIIDNENDAAAVNVAMAPLLALARETNAAVLLLFHVRKSPGDDGEDIRGSGDIFAFVDVALIMRRRKGDHANHRTIKAFSRYDDTPDEMVVALEDGQYIAIGDADAVKERELDLLLLGALTEVPRLPEEIEKDSGLGLVARTLRRHYNRLYGNGLCDREGVGQKSAPFKYKILAATSENVVATDRPVSGNGLKPTDGPLVRYAVEEMGLSIVGRSQ